MSDLEDRDRALGVALRQAIDSLPTVAIPTPLTPAAARAWPRMAGRALAVSTVVVIIAASALVAGGLINARRAALGSPPVAATSGSATSAYGLIVQGGGPSVIREGDATPLAKLYQEPIHRGTTELGVTSATSPDGYRVAYWIWGSSPPGLGSLALTRLALYDAKSNSTQVLLTLTDAIGAGVVWSTDGTGLLIGIERNPAGSQDGPKLAQLRTVDVASGEVKDIDPTYGADLVSRAFGAPASPSAAPSTIGIKPLSWDRAADRIVAAVGAPNPNYAREIVTRERGASHAEFLDGDFLMSSLVATPTGLIAGARTNDFAAVAWAAGDYSKHAAIVPAAGERILTMWWRPRTGELYFIRDNALTSDPVKWSHLEKWVPSVPPSVGAAPRIVDSAPGPWLTFRTDGSAYYMARNASPSGAVDVVDTDTGRVLRQLSDVRIVGALLVAATQTASVAPPPSGASRAPVCPIGETVVLDVAGPPPPGPQPGTGAATALEAFQRARPNAVSFAMYPLGSDKLAQSASDFGRGPAWVVAGDETFVVEYLGAPGGNSWFAYPAKWLGCRAVSSPQPNATPP